MEQLILASTSLFRADLLKKLGKPFKTFSPDIDESRRPGESPEELVVRLARQKAETAASSLVVGLIIGSDQVACVDGEILGKPGTVEKAEQQLTICSGKTVTFYTGLCLYNAQNKNIQSCCEPFQVHFRKLSTQQILRYIELEKPLNCAGSFKSEGLGISLFRKLEGDDPNALVGLPLIRLIEFLANEGIDVP